MPIKVARYKCSFCKKHYASMSGARRHEKTCFFKPANKSCITCAWSIDPKTGNGVRGGFCQISKQEIFQRFRWVLDCPDWVSEEVLGDD